MPAPGRLTQKRVFEAAFRWTLYVLLTINVGPITGIAPGNAQVAGASAAIDAPETWLVIAGSQTRLEISIRNQDALPHQTVILLRGLPAGIELSQGRLFGANVWVLPINKVGDLNAKVPPNLAGRAQLSIAIATLEGKPLAERSVTMVINARLPQPVKDPSSTAVGTELSVFRPKPPDRNLALRLINSGHDSMKVGNVLVARQFYQRAAEYGLAEAASSLAATYNQAELSRMGNMASVQADPKLAEKWYKIADELRALEVSAEVPKRP